VKNFYPDCYKKKMSYCKLYIGPMFSNKTTRMMLDVDKYTHGQNKKDVIILKWVKDFRGKEKEDTIVSHNGLQQKCIRIGNILCELKFSLFEKYDVVGIDEGHFFQKENDLLEFCKKLKKIGKIVIVSAIDTDFKKQPFMEVLKLITVFERVEKLNAVCNDCSSHYGAFTHKISKSKDRIDVGGKDKYVTLCEDCYNGRNKK